LSQFKIAKEIS